MLSELVPLIGAIIGAIITASVAIMISKKTLSEDAKIREKEEVKKMIEREIKIINDINSEIDINLFKAKKITAIKLHFPMARNNPQEACENCDDILGKLEEIEQDLQCIIKPLRSISLKSNEVTDDILSVITSLDEQRLKFKNMKSMYKNRLVNDMEIKKYNKLTDDEQKDEVSNSLIYSKKNINKCIDEYTNGLERVRKKHLKNSGELEGKLKELGKHVK
ncbi:hypothetical protein [Salinicoccus sp. YB14-2]|uniref:hypothetical protein n=1 Tax=Salinicoccus sp. YB14-2 TaxID=1572701 RepID=UPI00068FF415|nr:hypothetical protein [Salinicoccus sp. YB14-2]